MKHRQVVGPRTVVISSKFSEAEETQARRVLSILRSVGRSRFIIIIIIIIIIISMVQAAAVIVVIAVMSVVVLVVLMLTVGAVGSYGGRK